MHETHDTPQTHDTQHSQHKTRNTYSHKKDTRYSAACFAAALAVLLPWMLAFIVGGPALVGAETYRKLDVAGLDLAAMGIAL